MVRTHGLAPSGTSAPQDLSSTQLQAAADASTPLLARLARFAHGMRLQAVPHEVRRQARLNIVDTIACIASGAKLPESQQLLRAESSRGGPHEATVLGHPERLPLEAAVRVNAYMGDVFELNDLIGGHASIAVVVPALALAESSGATGAELIEAVIAGIEVVCRVHGGFYAYQKPFTETAMVQVTVASATGAAATASKLLKLDESQTLQAMAIAGALTSWGPAELVFGEGNSLKPILFGGVPGSTGLVAANYARHGLTGATRLLESPIGYYATVARGCDESVVLDFEHWRLAQPRRKLHACCGYMHSAIDSVARLRAQGALQGGSRIVVHLPGYIVPAICKAGVAPTTPNEARFNLEYCLAHAAVDADVVLPDHSTRCQDHLTRPEIERAMARFEVRIDPGYTHYRQSRIEVLDGQGRVAHSVFNDAPRGSEWNPMSEDDVADKFRRLVAMHMDTARIDRYLARFAGLESSPATSWLLRDFLDSKQETY